MDGDEASKRLLRAWRSGSKADEAVAEVEVLEESKGDEKAGASDAMDKFLSCETAGEVWVKGQWSMSPRSLVESSNGGRGPAGAG